MTVEIVSFGYLHGDPPAAHVTVDMRHHFRDPHINPKLRQLTAADRPVRRAVLRTRGVRRLLRATVRLVAAFAAGPSGNHLVIAVGCAGGRHRSAVAADQLGRRLRRRGHRVTVTHRDIRRPVVQR